MTCQSTPTNSNPFFSAVYTVVNQIPYGQVVTYGQIAQSLGSPRAARQVGWAMRHFPDDLPWHRVIKADGAIAGGGYAERRKALLESEKVPFLPDGRVAIARCRWEIPLHV